MLATSSVPPPVRIGLHIVAGAPCPVATVRALYDTIGGAFELLLLADPRPGEEARVAALLDDLRGVAQWRAPFPGGAAACFNRLVAEPAGVHVLIEAGAVPGPEWLDRLVAALQDDPANGIAAPDLAAIHDGTALEIERLSEAFATAPRSAWEPLAMDEVDGCCLAVRDEVVAALGAADPAQGPDWAIDYAERAGRAGFRAVRASGAIVWRGPTPPPAPRATRLRAAAGTALPLPPVAPRRAADDLPMISCIMPTRGRTRFVERAIAYYRAQDYPNRELVIVYDDDGDLPDGIDAPDIRLLRATHPSIGAKRNQGVTAARGAIVAQWDDDDWYGPRRLSHQAAPILAGVADVTALNDLLFLDVAAGAFWRVTRTLFRRLFVENVSGGSLVYRREHWRRHGPYPQTSLREDCDLLVAMMRGGARLCRLPARDHSIYVRHAHNTWQFGTGSYLDRTGWHIADEPPSFAADRAFYLAAPAVRAAPRPAALDMPPLVSCIMPTADRRDFVPRAIELFLAQDHPSRELIVIDDGADAIDDLIPADERIRYVRLAGRRSVGAKRNLACEMARGEIVAHWDDDDWMASTWLSSQVATLTAAQADIVGLDAVLFYQPDSGHAWRYVYDGAKPWVYGGTLCYTLAHWRRVRFADHNVGEDNAFVWSGLTDRIAVNPAGDGYVGTVHARNTSPKDPRQRRWHRYPAPLVERLIGVETPVAQAIVAALP